jgi:hypothetical protein
LRGEELWAQDLQNLRSQQVPQARDISYVSLITTAIQKWTFLYNDLLKKRQKHDPYLWWASLEVFDALKQTYLENRISMTNVDAALRTVFAFFRSGPYFVFTTVMKDQGIWLSLYRELCGILWSPGDFGANMSILMEQPGGAIILFEFMRWVYKANPDEFDQDARLQQLRVKLEETFVKVVANQAAQFRATPVFTPQTRSLEFQGKSKLFLTIASTPLAGFIEAQPQQPLELEEPTPGPLSSRPTTAAAPSVINLGAPL